MTDPVLTQASAAPAVPSPAGSARQWLRRASIEISPLEAPAALDFGPLLPAGTQAFIPWLPQTTPGEMVRAAAALKAAGLLPVPHIAARRLTGRPQAEQLLRDLASEAGAESVLLIGGDLARPAGPFDSALSLLQTGFFGAAGIKSVGISGYPEGHPAIDDARLQLHLKSKLACLRDQGRTAFIVSQFCFESAAILGWLERLRADGVQHQVRIGLAGPTRLRKLLAMGLRCGVGASMRALKGKSGAIGALLSTQGPEELIDALLQAPTPVVQGGASPHFFAFGGADITARWLAASTA